MEEYQREFIDFLVRTSALRFGEFTLKSGRISPYFFNAGEFNRAGEVERLGYFYASAVREMEVDPTILFGPAYKGVPLCLTTSIALKQHFGVDAYYTFDRKEIKDHGEGGWLVGKDPDAEDRIVMVDDVVTDGATKRDMVERLRQETPATIVGLVIALDRLESGPNGTSSVQALAEQTDVPIRAIVTVRDILDHLPGREIDGRIPLDEAMQSQIEAYLEKYGA